MQKINYLILNWKSGSIKLVSTLLKEGISYPLINSYKKNNWIEKIGNGAYKLFGDKVEIYGAINALQDQLDSEVHIGGRSAIELLGYSHFGKKKTNTVFLFGNANNRLPLWMKNYEWESDFVYFPTSLFKEDMKGFLTQIPYERMSVKISSTELAALEMLYTVPSGTTFNEASLIVNNLTTLRSNVMQILLEKCNSIKVKRLFLYLAELSNIPVFQKLNVNSINLGSGKRVIAKNGKLDSKYMITVPKESYNEK